MGGALNDEPRTDGVVCFAGVDWWYHNRGHSECQLMRRLAARTPVLWINSIGMRAPAPGRTELPLRRYARKLTSTLKGLRRDPCGMWVYSPLFIPRYTPTVLRWNGRLLFEQVRLLQRWLGIQHPAVWATVPTVAPAVERGDWTRRVFNRSDVFSEFPEVDAELIRGLEERMLKWADEVIYVNAGLLAREQGRVKSAHLLSHGVDYAHFARGRGGPSSGPEPPELRDLPRPIVGFYGALDDYTVDLDLMIQTARKVRPGTLLVIGPKAMELQRLIAEPNVVYLGPIPYEELPRYAARFDVGIMPWLRNRWIEGCNPIKLKEYLAIGFPIVSIGFPELEPYTDLVYAAADPERFLQQLDHALAEDSPARVAERRARVVDDSWDALAGRVAGMLGIAGGGPSPAPGRD